MNGMGDRRLLRRRPLRARVFVAPLDRRQPPFKAFTEDLSLEGAFLSSQRRLPIDARCLLRIQPEQGGEAWVKAQVVHLIDGFGFGCRFVDPPVETREALGRWLDLAGHHPHSVYPGSPRSRTTLLGY
jgi:hypothetical protein